MRDGWWEMVDEIWDGEMVEWDGRWESEKVNNNSLFFSLISQLISNHITPTTNKSQSKDNNDEEEDEKKDENKKEEEEDIENQNDQQFSNIRYLSFNGNPTTARGQTELEHISDHHTNILIEAF